VGRPDESRKLRNQVFYLNWRIRPLVPLELRTDCESFVLTFEPDQKRGPGGAGQSLLVKPCVVRTHVRVHHRPLRIQLRRAIPFVEENVHGIRAVTLSKPGKQRERLGAPPCFPGCPLNKRGGENLRSGALGEQAQLEPVEYGIVSGIQADLLRTRLRQSS